MAASTWPHWMLQLLSAAGLPTTTENVNWLRNWQEWEHTTCSRNPLNTYWPAPGSSRCHRLPNGKSARNYATRSSAADAFAQQLNLTDFPELRKALATGNPDGDPNVDALLLDLQKWGALNWQRHISEAQGVTIPDTGGGNPQGAVANVSGAWTNLHRVLSREGHATIVQLQRSTVALRRNERRLRRV